MTYSKIQLSLLFFFAFLNLSSQEDKILMVVNNDSITTSEFLRVYNKNLDLVKDEDQKDLDNYLDLFTEYQLKLNEARSLGLDKEKSYLREFQNYKQQLTKSYLSESEVTNELVEEAYERLGFDVRAVHILIRLDETASDTLSTYNKVLSLKERLENEDFNALREELHNGKTVFVEDLGYFTAFRMVYNFENQAYNTDVGQVSMPFRTQFGYHVVKVLDKRPSRGTITAAHIMVANEQQDSTIIPQQRIDLIYQKLQQGESFENLAKQFSDDKGSAKKGGELRPFKSGELSSPEFEEAAFSVKKDGEFSQPFETKFGWHIVKRISLKPLEDFESMQTTLQNKVKRDSRSKVINDAMVSELKNRYKVYEDPKAKAYFQSVFNDAYFFRQFALPEDFSGDNIMFSFNSKTYTYQQFGDYLVNQQRNYFKKPVEFDVIYDVLYKAFFESSILKFREENLENENPEFAQVLKEYRDGLLLFELMEREIWNKAAKDTIGLKNYYNSHIDQYLWKDRVSVIMASSADKKALKSLDTQAFNSTNLEALKTQQAETGMDLIFTKGVYPIDDPKLPENLKVKEGDISIYKHNKSYHLIRIEEILPQGQKTFYEAKGQVINDYQAQIESNWIKDLRTKYPVWIDRDVLEDLKSQN